MNATQVAAPRSLAATLVGALPGELAHATKRFMKRASLTALALDLGDERVPLETPLIR